MSGPLSIFIERLHHDERGVVASAELILGLPLFLLFWVLMWEYGVLLSAKLALAGETRTAAFMQAFTGHCLAPANHQEAMRRKSVFHPPSCSLETWPGASRFWQDMDGEGGEGLTRDVKAATAPRRVNVRLQADFRFHRELDWGTYAMSNRVVVMEPVRYTYEDAKLKYGYDQVLKDRVSQHGSLIDLFPGVFRGAR
ncbi:hypothetical protein [Rhizobium sp. L1K21]|uniref:hypothetical protein n=1 Tax=Rhizobium sp. L1K21 TaxID=2954933 RepID=UPI0020930871|nr:hypothetical protein [Rhizobium sp. L1K21]MCO6188239.1 hypothetical protein [Rhizobium sp. L1K21]